MNQQDYIEASFRIFGLYGVDKDGKCLCGNPHCKAILKHPRSSNWQHTPHWSDEQLDIMAEMGQFDTGFGVLCDEHIIIDIDPRNGGKLEDFQEYYDLSGFVVATGGGGWHIYFSKPKCAALVSHLPEFKGIDFKSSGYVVGCGSVHASGSTYEAAKGHPSEITGAPDKLLHLLEKKDRHRATVDGAAVDITDLELVEMLNHITPDCDYDQWYKCGMAIHDSTDGEGFSIWDNWSQGGAEYKAEEMESKWHSFGKSANPVKLGTLLFWAKEGGYQESVTFEYVPEEDEVFEVSEEIDISGIDLKRPPRFAGELTQWINSRCEYPTENLAVAASLNIISMCAGLKFAGSDKKKTTLNLFSYCVAGSGVGKQPIIDAVRHVMTEVGIVKAALGGMKSQKGIVKNLLTNQMAIYLIDEIGFELNKLSRAAEGKGSDFNAGTIGVLMSAYSAAGSVFGAEADIIKDSRDELLAQLVANQKRIDNNEDKGGRCQLMVESITVQLELLDKYNGIFRPFIGVMGFSTPENFTPLINGALMRQGFFSRSLIFQEHDTNPKWKEDFNGEQPLDENIKNTLLSLASTGKNPVVRIENYNERLPISISDQASKLIARIRLYFWERGEEAKEISLDSAYRRGLELTMKVCMIIGAPAGIVDEQDVLWAFALVKRDIDQKVNIAAGNMAHDDKRHDEALFRKLIGLLDKDTGMTTGVLMNRLRKYKKEDIEKALELLADKNKITSKQSKNKKGAKTKRWFLV